MASGGEFLPHWKHAQEIRNLGLRRVMLETGVAQPEVISLYVRGGFRRRDPYGGYVEAEDALTVYMEKELA
jgi:hypothetical protein